jgi:hypothetical protein
MKSLLLSCIIAAQVFFILLVVAACYATIFVYAEPVMMKIVIVWIFNIGAIVLLHLWARSRARPALACRAGIPGRHR